MIDEPPPQLSSEPQPEDPGGPLPGWDDLKWALITIGLAVAILAFACGVVWLLNLKH